MGTKNIPKRLWCYEIEHQSNMILFILQGREEQLEYEHIIGNTPDISEYYDFNLYYLIWYCQNTHPPLTKNHRENYNYGQASTTG